MSGAPAPSAIRNPELAFLLCEQVSEHSIEAERCDEEREDGDRCPCRSGRA